MQNIRTQLVVWHAGRAAVLLPRVRTRVLLIVRALPCLVQVIVRVTLGLDLRPRECLRAVAG